MQEGRDALAPRARCVSDDPASCPCEPMDSEDLLFLMYTSGTTAKPKGIVHTTAGYLVGVATTHHYIFDLKPDDGRVLVRRRRRLDHRPQLHRLRPVVQRRHVRALRRDARLPRQGAVVGDRRALRRDDPLHRADRDPRPHEVGPRACRGTRPHARSGCSAPSASRSTPRPGSGTTSTSAAAAAPSWTPGGRPRPG